MANALLYKADWERVAMNRLFGFNTDPRNTRVDEYERFNRIREELYARQDRQYDLRMRALGFVFFALLLTLVVSI